MLFYGNMDEVMSIIEICTLLSLIQYFIVIVYANHVNSSVRVSDVVSGTLINYFQRKFIDQVP